MIATYILAYVGIGMAIYVCLLWASRNEPTAHGQDAAAFMGCLLAVFWLPFMAYLIVASPWLAITWWQTRNER